MSFQVEKDWTTSSGLRAVVIIILRKYEGKSYQSHRCGYVGVSKESNLFGSDYSNLDISCHWGLTFSTSTPEANYPVPSELHWFGFDCIHCEDARIESMPYELRYGNPGVVRDLDYCVAECESIAAQLVELESKHTGD